MRRRPQHDRFHDGGGTCSSAVTPRRPSRSPMAGSLDLGAGRAGHGEPGFWRLRSSHPPGIARVSSAKLSPSPPSRARAGAHHRRLALRAVRQWAGGGPGPIRSQPRRLHYDLFDLAPYLKAGRERHRRLREVLRPGKSFWMPAAPNRTLGRTRRHGLRGHLGGSGWLVSDGSWKARRADAWDHERSGGNEPVTGGVPTEVFDARRFPHDWKPRLSMTVPGGSARSFAR